MRAVVFANGDITDYNFARRVLKSDDYLICADGAIRHFIALDITPDLWIGDFDSCNFELICSTYSNLKNAKIIKLNPDKDMTDTQAGCDFAIENGANEIVVLGVVGTRLDQTLSNIYLLENLLHRGVKAEIITENVSVRLYSESFVFKPRRKYVSLIPIDESVKINNTTGLKYNLKEFSLLRENSLGVSNEPISETVKIDISSGKLLVIESSD